MIHDLPIAQITAGAAELQGLREDPIPPFGGASAGLGAPALLQMVLALAAVVFVVKWLVPKYARKLSQRPISNLGSELVVEEAASVAAGQLLLVKARGHTLLVGAGSNGFALLADLSEDAGVLLPLRPPNSASPDDVDEPAHEAPFDRVLERLNRLQK